MTVEAWAGAGSSDHATRDLLLVVEHESALTLAVADGCTPTDRTQPIGRDGARYAASTVLGELVRLPPECELKTALRRANIRLLRRFGRATAPHLDARDRPQCAAAAVTVTWTHKGYVTLSLARAGDCEVWVRREGSWVCLTSQDMFAWDARTKLRRWDALNPQASNAERFAWEREVVGDIANWNVTAVGRFPRPKFESSMTTRPFEELVLVTDGARAGDLIKAGVNAARAWPGGGRSWTGAKRSARRHHDDVAMLHVRWASRRVDPIAEDVAVAGHD
jgi:hypothetical protein